MRIPDEFIKQLLKRVDLRTVLPEGTYLCPWHQDKRVPNLHIYQDHAYCFACGKYAGPVEATMLLHEKGKSLTFRQAVYVLQQHALNGAVPKDVAKVDERLNDWVNEYHDNLMRNDKAIHYLINRGITGTRLYTDLMLGCTVGRNDEPFAITIPHYNEKHEVCNIKFRILPDVMERMQREGAHVTKYWSLPGHKFQTLYPQFYVESVMDGVDYVTITEGEFDAMILLNYNKPALSLPSGVNSYYPLNELPYQRIYLAFDQDDAGDRAGEKWAHISPRITRIHWPREQGKDVTEYFLNQRKQVAELWR